MSRSNIGPVKNLSRENAVATVATALFFVPDLINLPCAWMRKVFAERMSPEEQTSRTSADTVRAALEQLDFSAAFRGMPPSIVARGRLLHQSAAVESFSWENRGMALTAEVQDDHEDDTVTLEADAEPFHLRARCTCPYSQRGDACKHVAAVFLALQTILSGRSPRNARTAPDHWENLADQFYEESREEEDAEGPIVLVDLDARHATDRYLYQPRPGQRLSYWDETPLEVESFASWRRADPAKRDERFYEWLCRPSQIGLQVKLAGQTHPVERHRPVELAGASELDLDGGLIRLRRRVWNAKTGEAVHPAAPIGEKLFFLKDARFGHVSEERFADVWYAGSSYLNAWFRSNGLRSPRMETDAFGAALAVKAHVWNELNFPWPIGGKTKEPPPLKVSGGATKATAAEPSISLDVAPQPNGLFVIRVNMTTGGLELLHAQEVLGVLRNISTFVTPGFARLRARMQALNQALLRFLAAASEKERKEVAKILKSNPAVARIQDGPGVARAHLRQVEKMYPFPLPSSLHVEAAGDGRWLLVRDALRMAAQAALVVTTAVPEAEIRGDDDGNYFAVPEQKLTRALPALALACQQAGLGLTFEDRAVETMQLDFTMRATRDSGNLDWFALAPQVMADGSLIPQEKWEAWVKGGMIRDAEGKLRVLSPGSAETLLQFAGILDLQGSETGGRRQRKGGPLRVPRLRIFDWLALRKAGVRLELPPEETRIIEALTTFDKLPRIPLPVALKAKLRPYQEDGYNWLSFLYRNRFGACLADDMGLGKTVQTIALLAATKASDVTQASNEDQERSDERRRPPHLVVLPPTLLFNWRHEIELFCPSLTVDELTGPQRDVASLDADVILTTYEIVRRDIEALEKRDFDVIVFDEAQAIKNLTGQRSRAMRRLKGRFKVCLTGTPMENHAGEYYSILELALPGLFGDYKRFMKTLDDEAGFRPIDRARPFVLRRTKEKILQELPEKTETDIWLDLTEMQKVFYSRAVAEVRDEVFKAFQDKTAQQAGIVALTALMRLRQICISPALIDSEHAERSPKVEYLLEKLRELDDEGHAALIFSQFTRTLDLVERELKTENLKFQRIDGKTPQAQRTARVAAFQKGTSPPFFLISLKTGGVGLNLTRASYVFHLDPWWNPAVENQASDRAHRIGQNQRVFVNRLLMRHTVEEKMMLLKERKRKLFDRVLSGMENRSGGALLTRDDMAWLLEG